MQPFLLLFFPFSIFGQVITAGITGGVPLTDTFDTGFVPPEARFTAKTVRYNVGPAIDFRIFGPLRGEVGALYQPFSSIHSMKLACRPTDTPTETCGNFPRS